MTNQKEKMNECLKELINYFRVSLFTFESRFLLKKVEQSHIENHPYG